MDRPALRRLLADIEVGRIDCVVVYKVDRLSRSLLDFSRIMEAFDNQHVSFVSVTQQFNTTNSMGRLVLNVLLSFAQFEREIISERTRDKIAAARRKGKWSGGPPILGYDVAPEGRRLVVNEVEAIQVREIFGLYLERESILGTVEELDARGWTNKRYVTRRGETKGGQPFTKASLHALLTNVLYLGKLRHKDKLHDGEHERIVDPEVWRRVQTLLARNGRAGGSAAKNQFGALLKGLLRCAPCDCSMVASHTTRPGGKRYRYPTQSASKNRYLQSQRRELREEARRSRSRRRFDGHRRQRQDAATIPPRRIGVSQKERHRSLAGQFTNMELVELACKHRLLERDLVDGLEKSKATRLGKLIMRFVGERFDLDGGAAAFLRREGRITQYCVDSETSAEGF